MVSPVMAFTDDLVIMARTPAMLQYRFEQITNQLAKSGLDVNPTKCRVSLMAVDGRNKRRYADTTTAIKVAGAALPNIRADNVVKYLGLDFNAAGITQSSGDKLSEHLVQLRKAPLKPQQRLYLLRANAIPALHTLVLGHCGRTTPRRLDQQVRREVRT